MAKQEPLQIEGRVTEALGSSNFKVELDNGHVVLCSISGKIRKHYIRILPGDRVRLEMTPYDLNRGRIVYRLKQ